MSSKLNICNIVRGHYQTLRGAGNRFLIGDHLFFFIIPLLLAGVGAYFGLILSEGQISLLVNFGAIFTALLLSVLILVYEQENKAYGERDRLVALGKPVSVFFNTKIDLLRQLYLNISYSIIVALFLIFFCFASSVLKGFVIAGCFSVERFLLTPLSIFLISNLMLTIVMVVKRLHVLLTVER